MATARLLLLALALGGAGGGPRKRPPGPPDGAPLADDPGGLLAPPPTGHGPQRPRTELPGRFTQPGGPRGGRSPPPPKTLVPSPLPGGARSRGDPPGGTPNPGGAPSAGGGNGTRRRGELGVLPPGGAWPEPWGWGAPVGAMAVAYAALGGAVLVGLRHRHRVLQSRKRQRRLRDPAQRFFRVTPPSPHSPYGNVLCPTAPPRAPPAPGSPPPGPPADPWGPAAGGAQGGEEEEEEGEGEGEEGYEHPDSEGEGPGELYENEPGPPGARSSVGSYENGREAAGGPWGAGPSPYANARLAPGNRLRERLDGRSEGSAGSQPYEDMAGGEGLYAAPRRGGGMGPEDDAGSYENMEGTRGEPLG